MKINHLREQETNEYGRDSTRQSQFLSAQEQGTVPDTSFLYSWSEKQNPYNNGLTARNTIAHTEMYQRYRNEEFACLQELTLGTINRIKQAKYLVDYGCGDSETFVRLLDHHVQSGTLSAKDLVGKEYIVYDISGSAVAAARERVMHYLTGLDPKATPRVHGVNENRNELGGDHHILEQFRGDKVVFSTGCTIGNLSESFKQNFINFDTKYQTTLVTTYFTQPASYRIRYIEATYGKKTEGNMWIEGTVFMVTQSQLAAMYEACKHQNNNILRAAGFTQAQIEKTHIDSKYDSATGLVMGGWVADEDIQIPVGSTTFSFQKGTFYPLFQSKRFGKNTSVLGDKKLFTKRSTLVGCDVYSLDPRGYHAHVKDITAAAAMSALMILSIWSYNSEKQKISADKAKQKAIIELIDSYTPKEDFKKNVTKFTTDKDKLEFFTAITENVGKELNALTHSEKFGPTQAYIGNLENYLITKLDGYTSIPFYNADRFVERSNNRKVNLAVSFLTDNPLILSEMDLNYLRQLDAYQEAFTRTQQLSDAERHTLSQELQGAQVKVVGSYLSTGGHIRTTYLLGVVQTKDGSYIVSLPQMLATSQKISSSSAVGVVLFGTAIAKQTSPVYVVGTGLENFTITSSGLIHGILEVRDRLLSH